MHISRPPTLVKEPTLLHDMDYLIHHASLAGLLTTSLLQLRHRLRNDVAQRFDSGFLLLSMRCVVSLKLANKLICVPKHICPGPERPVIELGEVQRR